ncbi:DHHC palmitoyltransferase-domain-containing protein [Lasiosphaeria ovina]|uniref:Palmitoyltransferase n=1 Tax=Lasiosphaeria ovina TaxID=92902 RepID=A0AAE0N1W8_9PEZI|nr:DHHC palmitoyltransferase-domain-containing protein [Lasiosphaeria ovina]
MRVRAHRPETRWATRIIPFVLAGAVGFSTYVVVKRICLDYFLSSWQRSGAAIAFIVLHLLFLVLMLLTYFRVFFVIQTNPGVVPLGPKATEQNTLEKRKKKGRRRRRGQGDSEGAAEGDLEAGNQYDRRPDENPDSPGLEEYYSKDVFICETDGRPRWCSTCCNWKPDRAHHCSEIERCVRKMDHYCPWVGGIVGETSFKFFVQFTFYAALYCTVVIVAAALCLRWLASNGLGVDGFVIAVLAIGAFFGLFTTAMTLTSIRYIGLNLTNIDYLKSKCIVHQLAIRVPRGTPPGPDYGVVHYPLPKSADGLSSPESALAGGKGPFSTRDQLATRTFAIVKTEMGENPWQLGAYRNWKSVMGNNIIDWFLPFNDSPCSTFENNESYYEMGSLYHQLRKRFNLPEISTESEESAMKKLEKQGQHQTNGL